MSNMITLKGVFPTTKQPKSKNFIRENVRNIRRISSHPKDDKSSEKSGCNSTGDEKKGKCISANSLFSRRSGSEQRVWSQQNCHHRQEKRGEKEKSNPVTKSNFDLIKSSNSNGKTRKSASLDRKCFVSRGIQTSFDCPLGKIQSISNGNKTEEEKIEPPSSNGFQEEAENVKRMTNGNKSHENDKEEKATSEVFNEDPTIDLDYDLPQLSLSESNVGQRENDQNQNKTKSNLSARNKNVPTHRLGVVPKYLLERKEAMLKEKLEKEAELAQASCPEGHILLPDQERKDTLTMLKKNYQDCINELNRLPIRSDTLRAHQKKMELEKKLNKLEDGIKVFSRPKVYVKVTET